MATAAVGNPAFQKLFCGFSKELNWRLTEFTHDPSKLHCCSLCGVISKQALSLPCSHIVCNTCFTCIARDHVCPVDKKPFQRSEAGAVTLSELQLLTSEVRCWNSRNGCNFVGPLHDALAHFHTACEFHTVKCSKCNNDVVRQGMLEHYMHNCTVLRPPPPGRNSWEYGTPYGTLKDIQRATEDIQRLINQLAENQSSLQDCFNNFIETSQEGLRSVNTSIGSQVSRIEEVCQKQEHFNRTSVMAITNIEASMNGLPSMLHHQSRLRNVAPQAFHLSGDKVCWPVENIVQLLDNENLPKIIGEPFLIGGYRARLTVKFDRSKPDTEICAYFSLRPGPNDDNLDWPFIIPLKMSLVHPNNKLKEKRRMVDPVASQYPEIFVRPTEDVDHGEGGCLVKRSEMEEYILEGALVLCVELIRDRDQYSSQFMERLIEAVAGIIQS